MPCTRPSKSSTKHPAHSGSRAPFPCHAVCTPLSVSGRCEITYRDLAKLEVAIERDLARTTVPPPSEAAAILVTV